MTLTMWLSLASIILSFVTVGVAMFNVGRTYGQAEGARAQAAVTHLIEINRRRGER